MPNPKPPLFASNDVLLDAAGIARFLRLQGTDWRTYRQLLSGGLSGATIERISLRSMAADGTPQNQTTLILKSLDPAKNWIMRATDDTRCREILFTQSPLWERLPQAIWSPIIACSLSGGKSSSAEGSIAVSATRSRPLPASGAILMNDLQPSIFPASRCYAQPDFPVLARILDHLAELHATFWEDPTLRQLSWLATPADAILAITPENLAPRSTDASMYVNDALAGWQALWQMLDPADATVIRNLLDHPAQLLAAVTQAPATLVHGDTWLANMGERNGRLVLLDWAFVSAGPPTFDSLWLANTWRTLDPDRVLTDHRAMLAHHGVAAVRDDATWDLLADLGWVRATLMGVESLVHDVIDPTSVVSHEDARARLYNWCHRTAQIVRTRGW